MDAKLMRGLAQRGLLHQVKAKSWREIFINWDEFARYYKRATGEANWEAKEALRQMNDVLWEYTYLTLRRGYAVGLESTGDSINLFPMPGFMGRFIHEEDASKLVRALGSRYVVLDFSR
jgi:hypothetical protein